MNNEFEKYSTFISQFSFVKENMALSKICDGIENLNVDNCDDEIKKFLKWDYELLSCCEIPLERRTVEQSYLYPMIVFGDDTKSPDIDKFEGERFEFYKHRLDYETNKILKLRYANYCFQYCDKGQRYLYANKICTILIDVLPTLSIDNKFSCYFSRLCELGVSYGDSTLIESIEEVIKIFLLKDMEDKFYLSALEVLKIISKNVSNKKINVDITKAIELTEKISNYYFQNKQFSIYRKCCENYLEWLKIAKKQDEINNVLHEIGKSYELDAENEKNNNLSKAEYYRMAAIHYANIGARAKVYELKVKIKNALKDADDSGEYKTISSTQSVPIEELNTFSKAYFKDTIEDTFNTVSNDIGFIPNPSNARKTAQKDFENNYIYKLIDLGHIDGNRKVFTTTSDNDAIKYLTYQIYGIELECTFAVYFNFLWNKMIAQGLTANMVIEKICSYEYMDKSSKNIVKTGIEKFFENDYISSLHILVPQFERMIRTFFEWGGFPTTSIRYGGLQYEQTFNDFLRQDYVEESLDTNLLFMIEYVMVEQIGKNLRNSIAHGLCTEKTLNKTNCLIVIYLFFAITNLKWEIETTGSE